MIGTQDSRLKGTIIKDGRKQRFWALWGVLIYFLVKHYMYILTLYAGL